MADQQVATHRRYAFLRYAYFYRINDNMYLAWDGKRRLEPGTAIPTTFPARAALTAAGYLVLEEIEGADTDELTRAGLSTSQAAAVLAAME